MTAFILHLPLSGFRQKLSRKGTIVEEGDFSSSELKETISIKKKMSIYEKVTYFDSQIINTFNLIIALI
ncbi:hypothetical protein [Methanosarcina barkeri]|uniref:hypothetical protein n=1 Tax=Methanosarcina barkeri TaxID=2208 RepID=UPI00064E9704|nr:hypothetical protein [Methanosarcina barkeri]